MPRQNNLEDRGQSARPPNPGAGARNQGGRIAAPSSRYQRQINPPPVSRSRKDSILRPVNPGPDGRNLNAEGSQMQGAPGDPNQSLLMGGPPGLDRGGRKTLHRLTVDGKGTLKLGVAGEDRQSPPAQNYARGVPPPEAPPQPRSKDGLMMPPEVPPAAGETPGVPGGQQEGFQMGGGQPNAPQPPEIMASQALDPESGQPMAVPPAAPPQSDPENLGLRQDQQANAGLPTEPLDQADRMNEMAAAPAQKSRMGEDQLGIKIEGSDQDPGPNMWKGEIGPGKPANQSGALGMPGVPNSPEDIAFNRTRFDQALKQSKGDKAKAALSSGAYPSGNPIAHGTMGHMQRLTDSIDGDGVDPSTLDEGSRRRYKQDAVRQYEEFGSYPGMDDPDSPPPPIRPLSFSYNPMTNKWVNPEGQDSLMERFGGSGQDQGGDRSLMERQ